MAVWQENTLAGSELGNGPVRGLQIPAPVWDAPPARPKMEDTDRSGEAVADQQMCVHVLSGTFFPA
jgi:hypothetical protein